MVKKKRESKTLSSSKEGLGISGFILGILSIALIGSGGILLSVVGFVFCLVQQKNNPMKLAKIGIILNIIGFVLSVAILILAIVFAPLLAQNLPLT
jgi:hypothetical protein